MSRRPNIVEVADESDSDAFDDDTDLPLPTKTLPNTGSKGALLEEINIETAPTAPADAPRTAPKRQPAGSGSQAGSAATPQPPLGLGSGLLDPSHPMFQAFQSANRAAGGGRDPSLIDPTGPEMEKYKKWTCIYPIYMDAKRAYGTGQRRIAREKSVWWPKSEDILTAAAALRLHCLHEPEKSHPRDWENPGRVKVLWKQDGRLANPNIPTKKRLFEMIAAQIQKKKPEQVPDVTKLPTKDDAPLEAPPKPTSQAKTKGATAPTAPPKRRRPPLPKPPLPLPPLHERYSVYSPLIPTGSLLEAWKVGTDKPPGADGAPTPAAAGGAGKGKRKVIRIRA